MTERISATGMDVTKDLIDEHNLASQVPSEHGILRQRISAGIMYRLTTRSFMQLARCW